MKVTKILGKKVLDNNGYEVGKISDIDLDIIDNKIERIFLSSNELSLKRESYKISQDTIFKIGDYVLLNISKKDIEEENSPKNPDAEVIDPKDLED